VSAVQAPDWRRTAAAILFVLLCLSRPCTPARGASDEGSADEVAPAASLVRVTSSFEVTHAGAVLRQVARLFNAGFVRRDADRLTRSIEELAAEQSQTWDFFAIRKGVTYPLRVRARIDAFGTLDLDFFAPQAVAGPVRDAVDGYLNTRGY
jgi:hypothetical protein